MALPSEQQRFPLGPSINASGSEGRRLLVVGNQAPISGREGQALTRDAHCKAWAETQNKDGVCVIAAPNFSLKKNSAAWKVMSHTPAGCS